MSVHAVENADPLYGLMAEFETAGELVAAARRTKEAGFKKFDAYTPFPIHELDDAMDLHDNRVALFTLIGGLCGAATGFGLASWVEAVALPLNIGGRPLISAPMFIPITFELTVLFGGLTAAISMIKCRSPSVTPKILPKSMENRSLNDLVVLMSKIPKANMMLGIMPTKVSS